jgi:hypothetical protein
MAMRDADGWGLGAEFRVLQSWGLGARPVVDGEAVRTARRVAY